MNVLKYLRYMPKHFALVLAAIFATTTVATAVAWGPNRDTYTTAQPADHIVFNSITDNPSVGDERDFVVIKDAANQNPGGWTNSINAVPGKEYLVRIYVHNNAGQNLNLKAQNTRVSVGLPTNTAKNIAFSGFVSADNATPQKVWDDAALTSTSDFNVAYVPGSAKLYNNVTGQAGRSVSDSIVTSAGALVGYEANNGVVPGCFEFASYVTLKIKVQGASADFDISKMVRKAGTQTWAESVAANPGDKVQYRIKYTNKSTVQNNNVVVKDTLPAGVNYVNGSTKLYLGSDPNTARPMGDNVTKGGINIGSYAPGGMAMVIFDATVKANDELPVCGPNTLKNVATVETDYSSKTDDANVTVTKNCPPTPKNIQVCDLATKNIITIREDQFDAAKHSKDLNKCAPAQPGSIKVCVIASKQIVTIKENEFDAAKHSKDLNVCNVAPATPVTPAAPRVLAATGPEALLGGLVGSSALGYGAYSYAQSRRTLVSKLLKR